MKNDITGIILAGGKSSRMNHDKGLLLLDGKPLVEHVISQAQKVCTSIMIISNQSGYEKLKFPVHEDLLKDCGPMAGIYTGLYYSQTAHNLVLGCDIPFVNEGLLQYIIEGFDNFDAVIPTSGDLLQPLCGAYNKQCMEKLKEALDSKNYKIQDVIKLLNRKLLVIDKGLSFYSEHLFTNINTESALEEAQKLTLL